METRGYTQEKSRTGSIGIPKSNPGEGLGLHSIPVETSSLASALASIRKQVSLLEIQVKNLQKEWLQIVTSCGMTAPCFDSLCEKLELGQGKTKILGDVARLTFKIRHAANDAAKTQLVLQEAIELLSQPGYSEMKSAQHHALLLGAVKLESAHTAFRRTRRAYLATDRQIRWMKQSAALG